jgi:hypothetical protein
MDRLDEISEKLDKIYKSMEASKKTDNANLIHLLEVLTNSYVSLCKIDRSLGVKTFDCYHCKCKFPNTELYNSHIKTCHSSS